jgi:modification methylase
VLFDSRHKFEAVVRADGSIASNDIEGSIHQVGATLQGLPSCNGWKFWHFKQRKSTEVLDTLRQKLREEMISA